MGQLLRWAVLAQAYHFWPLNSVRFVSLFEANFKLKYK